MSKKAKSTSIPRISAEIRGIRYTLTPRNLHIQEKIDSLEKYANQRGEGSISVKKFYKMLVEFVKIASKCKDFDCEISEINLAELEIAVTNILSAYASQVRENTDEYKRMRTAISSVVGGNVRKIS